jgi:hypothetical protein
MTPSIIIAVLIATGIWAVIASIIAHNRGREYNTMAERHNSVVDALRKTELKMAHTKTELREAAQDHWANQQEADRAHLAALERIDQLTEEKEQWKGEYISAANRANRFEAMHKRMTTRHRDPKTGRIVKADWVSDDSREKAAELLCDEVKANASEEAFDDMMGNPMQQLNGLTVKQKSSSQGCAGND